MKRTILNTLKAIVVCTSLCTTAQASLNPRPIGGEHRIKIINYTPNTVFRFFGHYTYQSIIEFDPSETITTISMGVSSAWQLIPSGNRIFIKPIDDDATTNMTVITNRRMYFFELHAEEARSVTDENLSFIVKFVYPEDINLGLFGGPKGIIHAKDVDLSDPSKYNLNYMISGESKVVEPLQVFDDGEFTYFKFKDINAEIPSIFEVKRDNTESLVNFRIQGNYVVVERVSSKFTLRHGADIICIFNEGWDDAKQESFKKN